jgi:hypothetical protein
MSTVTCADMKDAKTRLRYLRRTTTRGVTFKANDMKLQGFNDTNYPTNYPIRRHATCGYVNEMKMIYNNTNKLDRPLSNGHQLLSYLGHLRLKIGLGPLRLCAPIDTPTCNVCRRYSEAKNCKQPQ